MTQSPHGIAIVTGASRGIGQATAERLSRDGFALLITGRDETRLKKVAAGLQTPCHTVAVDLADASAAQVIVEGLKNSAFKNLTLTALINNAAIFHRQSFLETSEENWRQEFETNLMAPVRLIRQALPHFAAGGVILNVSSTLGLRPIVNTLAYSAIKAGLNNLTQGLALELAPRIRVCAVCPGLTDTPIHPFHQDSDQSEARRQAHAAQPMKRMGRPEDIASMISFLVGPESAWNTGSIHVIDGGISLL
ncbi:MAG: SDR family NAD(P)-dependent oxidoreductase [Bdellovibrionales bacterium]